MVVGASCRRAPFPTHLSLSPARKDQDDLSCVASTSEHERKQKSCRNTIGPSGPRPRDGNPRA